MLILAAIIGARPQFIKHAPVELVLKDDLNLLSIHTGQHYDKNMSEIFFDDLGLNPPDYNLHIGSGSHGAQTGKMMISIEEIIMKENPDAIMVYGDTNSTLAGALVGSKLRVPVIHIEAGMRSYNRDMPEEVNRVVTDNISDLLFASTEQAVLNLRKEGITENVFCCGDVMIDLLSMAVEKRLIKAENVTHPFYYATIHRPYNTDVKDHLLDVLENLNTLDHVVIFSRHPRTEKYMSDFGIKDHTLENIRFIEPVSYFQNLAYILNSAALITDSGGMQKEAYFLKKKCITIRPETEWTETLENGWNTLVFSDLTQLKRALQSPAGNHYPELYGGGNASEIIRKKILDFLAY